jgi:hypothetical protein
MIIPTLVAKPHHGLLFQDRIPVQSPGGSPIASVLALASDVRTMLGHEMRFEDLVPLLALGNCWRLAAHRTGLWRGGALDRSSIEAAMPLFQGFSGVSHLIYGGLASGVGERWTVQPRYLTA